MPQQQWQCREHCFDLSNAVSVRWGRFYILGMRVFVAVVCRSSVASSSLERRRGNGFRALWALGLGRGVSVATVAWRYVCPCAQRFGEDNDSPVDISPYTLTRLHCTASRRWSWFCFILSSHRSVVLARFATVLSRFGRTVVCFPSMYLHKATYRIRHQV